MSRRARVWHALTFAVAAFAVLLQLGLVLEGDIIIRTCSILVMEITL